VHRVLVDLLALPRPRPTPSHRRAKLARDYRLRPTGRMPPQPGARDGCLRACGRSGSDLPGARGDVGPEDPAVRHGTGRTYQGRRAAEAWRALRRRGTNPPAMIAAASSAAAGMRVARGERGRAGGGPFCDKASQSGPVKFDPTVNIAIQGWTVFHLPSTLGLGLPLDTVHLSRQSATIVDDDNAGTPS